MKNPEGFKSYGHIQSWLKEKYNLDIKYGTLYSTVRYGLKAKLKVARPVNIKKNKDKEEEFKLNFKDKLSPILNNSQLRLFSFDESRFGLITVKRRRVTLKGVKPLGKVQTEYKYYWLYGAFDVLSGESFYWEFNKMNKLNCQHFINKLSTAYADTLNIVLMDNSSTHLIDDLPDNIKIINTEPYCPELNPAERVWREFKDKISWMNFDSISKLQEYVNEIIKSLSNQKIISLIQYPYIIQACHALKLI